MEIGAPQIIWLCVIAIGLGGEMAKHGKPRNYNHNFWITAIAAGLNIGLLYWGGFFG